MGNKVKSFMNFFVIILALSACLKKGNAQTLPKYYENIISGYLSINTNSIIIDTDTSFIIGGRLHLDNSFETFKSYLAHLSNGGVLSDIHVLNSDTVNGDFGISDFIKTEYGFVLTGNLSTNESDDTIYAMIAKTDYLYTIQNLQRIVIESKEDMGNAIAQNAEGDLFIGGYYTPLFISPNRKKLYLTKLSPSGEKLWEYTNWIYPYHCAFSAIFPAADGGCYAAGYVNVNPPTSGDFFFIKINSTGIAEWEKIYSFNTGNGGANALGLSSANDNSFVLCGSSNYGHSRLLKTDSEGDSIWSREYFPNEQISSFLRVSILPDNNIVSIGSVKSYGISGTDMLITKVDSLGNLMWHRRYGQPDINDYGYDFTPVPIPKGGFVVVGRTDTIVNVSGTYWSLGRGYVVKTNCMGLLTVPQAAFTISQDPDLPSRFQFTNQSQYAYPDSIDGGYYLWNWGDGSPPFICGQDYAPCNQDTLIHTYQAEGVYGVTLQAIVCNDTSTLTQSVCLGFAPDPQAAFSYEDFGGAIIFTNLSQNAYTAQGGYYTWDFGDGNPQVSQEQPNHTYEENGSYTVTLSLIVCQDTSVYTQTIDVQTVGILPPDPLKGENSILVYPNPAQNTLTFAFTEGSKSPLGDLGVNNGWGVGDLGVTAGREVELTLFTLTGQPILQTTLSAGETSKTISVAHLPAGLYIYVVSGGGVVSRDTDNNDTDNGNYGGNNGGFSSNGGGAVLARGKVAIVR